MKMGYATPLIFTLMLIAGAASATESADIRPQVEAAHKEAEALMVEAEQVRADAERARTQAEKAREQAAEAAELAREISQREAREARLSGDEQHRYLEERERERAARKEEVERAREELSRAHRELREASREIARAHRELSRTGEEVEINMEVNLGDRAVIGVVLGEQSSRGVKIIGVSPDGPAERAGLQPGDTLVAIRGIDLLNIENAREAVFEVMSEVSDGEEFPVIVERDGQTWEYRVTAEQREPSGWQSVIRIPEVPEIDQEVLAAEIAELSRRIEGRQYTFINEDGETISQFEFGDFSEFGDMAMDEASIWFGLPQADGLELAVINSGLGAYFDTDRGVLVLRAREQNAYELRSGDVILSIGGTDVNSPSDMMRTLRDVEPGSEIAIDIKRDRRDITLKVTVPENRLGSL